MRGGERAYTAGDPVVVWRDDGSVNQGMWSVYGLMGNWS